MTDAVPAVSPATLRRWLAEKRSLTLLDVRRGPIFAEAADMLPAARWRDPFAVEQWSRELDRGLPVVAYCVHGHEISQNAARALASAGFEAYTLEEGIEGWRAAGGPTVPKVPR
jgi:Fe-Mn family superoxide dismutase